MSFWSSVKRNQPSEKTEEVIDLQDKLSKLDLSDIDYLYKMMINGNFRGRELEQATTTYLKIKYIKANLEANNEQAETEDSSVYYSRTRSSVYLTRKSRS